MDVWTIQLARARTAERAGVPVLNTTIKCGEKVFAPTWDMVMDVKAGRISQETYTELYMDLMRDSIARNRTRWFEVTDMPVVAVACMCPKGVFCHRHILVKCFEAVCTKRRIPFRLLGEWESQ